MVAHRNEPAGIRPLRPAARSHNLPAQLTPLLGRDTETAAVRGLLLRDGVRLVTLTGMAGAGKTRLALHVAAGAAGRFAGGAWFVPLETVRDPHRIIPAIAAALDVRETGARPLRESLIDYLQDRATLLLLDNFEQVLEAAPRVVELLAACPTLTCLVTSRAPLHLRGEHEFPLAPLPVPPDADGEAGTRDRERTGTAAGLRRYAAVELFVQRVTAIRPDFRLTTENAGAVAEICRRLDGLPLAIELAAARVRALPPHAILARLERRLPLLEGGPRDLPARHQNLREAIAWSYDLLSPAEQTLFRRLGVFAGGCTIEAAGAVCDIAADAVPSPLDLLTALVENSLLRQEAGAGDEPRFRLLDTVREYAVETLRLPSPAAMPDEAHDTARRHAAYFLALAERAEPELYGAAQELWLRRMDDESENVRAALAWLLAAGRAEDALRLCAALRRVWSMRGRLTEGREWLERALAAPGEAGPSVRAEALNAAGDLARLQGDYAAARAHHARSLAIFRTTGEDAKIAWSLDYLGVVLIRLGEYPPARTLLDEGLAIARRRGDLRQTALLLHNLGDVDHEQGVDAPATPLFEEALAMFRQAGDGWGIAHSLNTLGDVAWARGDHAAARTGYAEALAAGRAIGNPQEVAWSLLGLGHADIRRGDTGAARAALAESLVVRRQVGNRQEIAESLEGLAMLAIAGGHAERAARLFGAAGALRQVGGSPAAHARRATLAEAVAAARGVLGEEAFAAAYRAGAALPPDQAMIEALAPAAPALRPAAPPARGPGALTPREREIALRIARGLTNHQIAGELVISERTADTHVAHILAKLGFATRSQVAAWVAEQGWLA
jgi:predicted ATPase/DNA-binding CsgD family transcriptional regulator